MFASKTFIEHILRGIIGVFAIIFAIKIGNTSGAQAVIASLALGVAALFALRGCPICWTTGLVEMIVARVKR